MCKGTEAEGMVFFKSMKESSLRNYYNNNYQRINSGFILKDTSSLHSLRETFPPPHA